jgi:hypothetical protein
MKEYPLGTFGGLRLSASPSAVVGLLVLAAVLTLVGLLLLDLAAAQAVLFGLLGTLLHFLSELAHQFGHAWAARRTGYPMTGVRFWTIFGASLYPADEPALPAAVHIRRALGGPPVSLLLAVLALPLVLALRSSGGLAWWLALLFFLENLLVFGLGAFLPLGFNDGSTLLYWWGKQ